MVEKGLGEYLHEVMGRKRMMTAGRLVLHGSCMDTKGMEREMENGK